MKYGPQVDWWSLGILMYMMMVGDMPFDFQLTVFFDAVRRSSAQFPLYLSKNAVSILNGVSTSNIKTEALGVCCSLCNAVFFHSWYTDCIAIK